MKSPKQEALEEKKISKKHKHTKGKNGKCKICEENVEYEPSKGGRETGKTE